MEELGFRHEHGLGPLIDFSDQGPLIDFSDQGPLIDFSDQVKEFQFEDHQQKLKGLDLESLEREDPLLTDHPHKLMGSQMAGDCLEHKRYEKSSPSVGSDFPDRGPLDAVYMKQLYESEGFDVDHYPYDLVAFAPIQPLTNFRDKPSTYEDIVRLTESAITVYNKQNDTTFKLVDVVKVNFGVFEYYITFIATDGSRNLVFQTWVAASGYGTDFDVMFCRLKAKKMQN